MAAQHRVTQPARPPRHHTRESSRTTRTGQRHSAHRPENIVVDDDSLRAKPCRNSPTKLATLVMATCVSGRPARSDLHCAAAALVAAALSPPGCRRASAHQLDGGVQGGRDSTLACTAVSRGIPVESLGARASPSSGPVARLARALSCEERRKEQDGSGGPSARGPAGRQQRSPRDRGEPAVTEARASRQRDGDKCERNRQVQG